MGSPKGQGVSICLVKSSGQEWSKSLKYHFKSELSGLTLNTKPCWSQTFGLHLDKYINKVLLRFELGSLDSKFRVLTTTPENLFLPQCLIYLRFVKVENIFPACSCLKRFLQPGYQVRLPPHQSHLLGTDIPLHIRYTTVHHNFVLSNVPNFTIFIIIRCWTEYYFYSSSFSSS